MSIKSTAKRQFCRTVITDLGFFRFMMAGLAAMPDYDTSRDRHDCDTSRDRPGCGTSIPQSSAQKGLVFSRSCATCSQCGFALSRRPLSLLGLVSTGSLTAHLPASWGKSAGGTRYSVAMAFAKSRQSFAPSDQSVQHNPLAMAMNTTGGSCDFGCLYRI